MQLPLAYVDPGTGATMMQLVLAGTVGISAIVKLKWNSIRALFQRSDVSAQEESEAELRGVSEGRDESPT
jgi:hypothetical protein